MDTIKPYLKNLILADGGLKTIIIDTLKQELTALIQLPSALNNFLDKANSGTLEVQIKNKHAKHFYALGQQFLLLISIFFLFWLKVLDRNASWYNWKNIVIMILGYLLFRSIRKYNKL
jgi:hypothetical protein